jgi:hypothetical protein
LYCVAVLDETAEATTEVPLAPAAAATVNEMEIGRFEFRYFEMKFFNLCLLK